MFDSPKELLDRIRLGEGAFLELKEVRFAGGKVRGPGRDDLADELAAFANGRGGVCLLGVTDERRDVVGVSLERVGTIVALVREICTDSIEPPLNAFIEPVRLPTGVGEELPVIKIDVPRSLFVHQSPGGYLHRVGDAKRRMGPDYLFRLQQQRSQTRLIRFDEQIVPGTRLEDLSPALWERFRTPRTGASADSLLSNLRMAREDDDGVLRPTLSGVLLASGDPRRWLPNAFIQAVAYRGTRVRPDLSRDPYQLDAADLTGPLDAQVEEACRFVAKNMKVAAFKHLGRVDRPQFDMEAVFEAMVNAVAHRDYSIYGAKIRLRLFDDRLELYSPGAIPNTISVERLVHLQSSRNEVVTSLLAKCPVPTGIPWLKTERATLMEKRGEGVRLILENSRALSGREPEYREIDEAALMLTIHAPAAPVGDGGSRGEEARKSRHR